MTGRYKGPWSSLCVALVALLLASTANGVRACNQHSLGCVQADCESPLLSLLQAANLVLTLSGVGGAYDFMDYKEAAFTAKVRLMPPSSMSLRTSFPSSFKSRRIETFGWTLPRPAGHKYRGCTSDWRLQSRLGADSRPRLRLACLQQPIPSSPARMGFLPGL